MPCSGSEFEVAFCAVCEQRGCAEAEERVCREPAQAAAGGDVISLPDLSIPVTGACSAGLGGVPRTCLGCSVYYLPALLGRRNFKILLLIIPSLLGESSGGILVSKRS